MSIHAYLLLDSSASMTGAPLEALKQALHLLCGTFISRSKKHVLVSVISYDSTAKELSKLIEVISFEMPTLQTGGSSALGAALRLVEKSLPESPVQASPTPSQPLQPENHSSLVYIFTDGEPTDDWENALKSVRPRLEKIFVIACGLSASSTTFDSIVDRVYRVRELTPDLLFETFRSFT